MSHSLNHLIILIFLCLAIPAISQDSLPVINKSYLTSVSEESLKLKSKLNKQSQKALARMQKLESSLRAKLMKVDSAAAKNIFASADEKYKQLQERMKNGTTSPYIASLDTTLTSLKFLDQYAGDARAKLSHALKNVNELKDKFRQAEEIKAFLKERKELLKNSLSKFDFTSELKKISKNAYYFSQQVSEYKAMLKDHKKVERKTLELLGKSKLFKDFMRKNSQLASLFRLPGNSNDPMNMASLAGLQTRAQVNNLILQQVGTDQPARQQFSTNLQSAQGQLNVLKNKLVQSGSGGSDDIMPEGFKPNNQKTKGFLKRLEYGTNIQTQKATNFFPVTSDIGVSVGYKLNDNSVIGVGASYKLGLGSGWKDITISNQGLGVRSFIDFKIRGSFWATGGYEQNYKTAFNGIDQLKDRKAWQQSGLIGLSKVVSLKTKFFKKTKLQLLWDFLSDEQVPKTQPILFRVGYTF